MVTLIKTLAIIDNDTKNSMTINTPVLPRIGEQIIVDDILYEVMEVRYLVRKGKVCVDERKVYMIVIYLKTLIKLNKDSII
jgi:hypothetical protein